MMSRKMAAGWLLFCLGISLVVLGWRMAGEAQAAPGVTAGAEANADLLRMHIIANSDSPDDQELKLKVRDAVMAALAPRLAGVKSAAEAEAVLRSMLGELEAIGAGVISAQGKTYPIRAEIGRFSFPGKSYGDLYLPAGEYKALRLVIGEGKGANFWCLIFPSLCYRLYELQRPAGGSAAASPAGRHDQIW